MKKILTTSLVVWLILTGYAGIAQADPPDGEAGNFLRVKGIYWDGRLDGDITASTKLVTGNELDLHHTLDLEKGTYIPEVELKINIPIGGKIIGSYWQAKYEGKETITQDISFAGKTFSASEYVQTDLSLAMGTLLYEITFVPEFITRAFPSIAEAEAGLLLGVKYLHTEAELRSSITSDISETFGVPIPVIGLFLQVGFLEKVKVEVGAVGFGATSGDITARFTDLYVDVKIDLIKQVPLGLGYKSTGFNVKDESGETFKVNLEMKGLYLFATLEF